MLAWAMDPKVGHVIDAFTEKNGGEKGVRDGSRRQMM
jgi:hypothetical protein